MPAASKQTIFISHASQDQSAAQALYEALTSRYHFTCWMDKFDLQTDSRPFSEQIVESLRGSNLIVIVDSPAARESDYVRREIQLGRDLQLPIMRFTPDEHAPDWRKKIMIQALARSIQLRLALPFLAASLVLFLLLAALAGAIFFFGTQVVPALAKARNLPAAVRQPTPTLTQAAPSDPKLAAPFHFKPATVLLQDDFNDPAYENKINSQTMTYNILPRNTSVKVGQQDGSLVIRFPTECLNQAITWDCELELDSNVLNASAIQYFGLRARTVERTSMRDVLVSISINEPNRSRAGFGWDFSDHAMAFFRSIPALPEKDLYAYARIDNGWHAYEIVRNSQTGRYDYYVDGQLTGLYTPIHFTEWSQAPLRLIIYSLSTTTAGSGQAADTLFEMDQVIIGGFTSK